MRQEKVQFEDCVDWYLRSPQTDESSNVLNTQQRNANDIFNTFLDKPFYCWDTKKFGLDSCCFNHMIGLPEKNDEEHPFYDYEKEMFDKFETGKHIWIKKSKGIGATTFILRYIVWKIVRSNALEFKNVFIISGTREEFSNQLKKRMEELFVRAYPLMRLQSKYTELWIKNTWIKVFPSKNIKGLRGYIDVSFIFVDEADFFEPIEQNELESVIKAYEEKSKGQIIMVSTPNRPDGLFYKIEHENKFGKSYFHKILLDYRRGMGKIYNDEFIARERDQPYFEREYNLKYLGKIGNVFSPSLIQSCTDLGQQYRRQPINKFAYHPVGVDYGYSDSKTVICIGEWDNEKKVLWICKMDDFGDIPPTPELVANRMHEYNLEYGPNTHFFVDGSSAASVNQAKIRFSENLNWRKQDMFNKSDRIHPIHFGVNQEHKRLLETMYHLASDGKLAIDERYDKLITSMRTAQMIEWDLDKNDTVHNDHLDACRLMCRGISLK